VLSVVRFHRGKKGGCFWIERRDFGLQHRGQVSCGACGQQALAGQGAVEDVKQEPHPLTDIGLTHVEQLAMDLLDGVLFEIGQDEQEAIVWRRQRTVGIGDRAVTFADIAIESRAVEVALHRQGKMRQEVRECGDIEAGKGA
jgi:hypothetical protein